MFMGMEKHTITDGTSRMSFELVARNGQKLLGDDGLELIVRLTDEPMHVGGYMMLARWNIKVRVWRVRCGRGGLSAGGRLPNEQSTLQVFSRNTDQRGVAKHFVARQP